VYVDHTLRRLTLMLIRIKPVAVSVLLATAVLVPTGFAQTLAHPDVDTAAAPKKAELQQQLLVLRNEMAAIKAVIAAKDQEQSSVAQELQRAELAIAESARAVIQINGQLASAQTELDTLSARASQLATELKTERAVLAQLLRSAYAIGQLEQVKLALSQAKMARVGRVLAYHTYVNRARIDAIASIQTALSTLHAVQQQINSKRTELVALLNQEARNAAELTDRKAQREALLTQLRAELAIGNQRVESLNANADQLNDLLSRLSDLLADIPKVLPNARAFQSLKSARMPWPVEGKLIREFGALLEGGRPASGILIQPAAERAVHAVAGGRVAFSDWLRGFGMLLIIDHGDGYLSLYGQCETLLKTEGDWIDAGTMVATLGTDALHFEIRQSGVPINPAAWLQRR
jgi:murein hydrolase activator